MMVYFGRRKALTGAYSVRAQHLSERTAVMSLNLTPELIAKYWQRVDRQGPDECWPWLGSLLRGYGQFYVGGERRYVRATHVGYEIAFGPLPEGKIVAHSCDHSWCHNDAHFRAWTQLENIEDRNRKGRQDHGPNAPHHVPLPLRGAARGERCGRAKLTADQVREIRASYIPGKRGCGMTALAKKYGVHDYAIEMIVKRRSWKHVE